MTLSYLSYLCFFISFVLLIPATAGFFRKIKEDRQKRPLKTKLLKRIRRNYHIKIEGEFIDTCYAYNKHTGIIKEYTECRIENFIYGCFEVTALEHFIFSNRSDIMPIYSFIDLPELFKRRRDKRLRAQQRNLRLRLWKDKFR